MRINKHDTNGVKPLLGKGELGYDDYTAGGDTGRVYVGTGSVNIPQAKKAEVIAVDGKVDTHTARADNPHSVTKTQVGLGNVQNVDTTNASNITSGTLANVRLANSGVTAGTYKSVTVDGKGIVTGGTNPTTLSGYSITDAYTKTETNTQISTAVAALVDSSPGTLDTLNELAAALGDDPNFATTTANAIAAKVPKVTSTDNAIVRFDGTTGVVQNSAITIDDNGNIGSGTQTFNGFGGGGSKNMLINSGFTIWSKGESFSSIPNETYAADNWKIGIAGVPPSVVYKGGQVFQVGTITLAINGANGNTTIQVRQYIEDKNCRKLYSGKKVTISFDIYANSNVPANKVISINMDRPAGTNDWTSSYAGIGSSITIQPNTATRQSVTLTIPSDYYKWGTRLILTIVGGLQTGQTIAIGNIQMEEGSIATPYEQKTEQKEIEENSRYIQKIDSPYSGYTVFCVGANNTTTQFTGCLKLPYPMYSLISGTVYGNFQLEGIEALSSVYVDIHNARDRVLVRGTTGVSTVGRAGTLIGNGDSTAAFLLTSYLG